jgi:hypothetical protein
MLFARISHVILAPQVMQTDIMERRPGWSQEWMLKEITIPVIPL